MTPLRRRPATAGRGTAAVVLVALLTLGGLLATSPWPAHAHADLLGSSPRDGGTVGMETARLVLVFGEDLDPGRCHVAVQDPSGRAVARSVAAVEASTLVVALAVRRPGPHHATYRVVSRDGHIVVGEVRFVVRPAVARSHDDGTTSVAAMPPPEQAPPPGVGPTAGTLAVPGWAALTLSLAVLGLVWRGGRARQAEPHAVPAPDPTRERSSPSGQGFPKVC